MDLKGTKTEKNLQTAFAGESQARNKYTFYASKAKKEGYVQISNIFAETAGNEKEHAELWFKALHGGEIPQAAGEFPGHGADALLARDKLLPARQHFVVREQHLFGGGGGGPQAGPY